MLCKLFNVKTNENLYRSFLLGSAVCIITGLVLTILNTNVTYLGVGIGCLALGGYLVLAAFSHYRKTRRSPSDESGQLKALSSSSLSPKEDISHTLKKETSTTMTSLRTSYVSPLSRIPQELQFPPGKNPIPSWLPTTFLYPLNFIYDPLVLECIDPREKECILKTRSLPYTWLDKKDRLCRSPLWQLAIPEYLNFVKSDSAPLSPLWTFDAPRLSGIGFSSPIVCEHWHYIIHNFKKSEADDACCLGNFLYMTHTQAHSTITIRSQEPLDTCDVNVQALEKISLRYRHGYHISLFIVDSKNLEVQLQHEISQRDLSLASPYFGFLVIDQNSPKTPTSLLFYIRVDPDNSDKRECQCLFLKSRSSVIGGRDFWDHKEVFNIIRDQKNITWTAYRNHLEMSINTAMNQFLLLAHALIDLKKAPYKSLKNILKTITGYDRVGGNAPYQACELPGAWISSDPFLYPRNCALPEELQTPSIRTQDKLIENYQKEVPYQMTYELTLEPHQQQAWLPKLFADTDTDRKKALVPKGVTAIWSQETNQLTITIMYTHLYNRYAYELAQAHYKQNFIESSYEPILLTISVFSESISWLIAEYCLGPCESF